ncbi:MAG: hypothetical protein JJ975_03970 [Bacteroidia bacterium]|nr:hypothetical protein [Bacteroidia bacterium]
MKRYAFILMGLVGITLFSCRTAQNAPRDASIVYQRTACFGTCPIYSLTITGQGEATFEGKRFTEKIGAFTKQLSKDETKSLFRTLNAQDWASLDSIYPSQISDLPSTVFAFRYKKTNKEVVVTGEHPASLDVVSKLLSEIAESDGWTSTITE